MNIFKFFKRKKEQEQPHNVLVADDSTGLSGQEIHMTDHKCCHCGGTFTLWYEQTKCIYCGQNHYNKLKITRWVKS
jgi:hypothetical protein